MTDSLADPQHFTKAATQLGEHQQVIAIEAIVNRQGVKVLEKGAAISASLYERLMRHQLSAPLEDSVASTNAVSGPVLRQMAEDLMRDVPFFSRLASDDAERKLILSAIESIPLPSPMAFQLTVARDVRPEVFSQLVRTALISVWLARVPEVSRYDLGMAAAAGMLHDIGMLHVDPMLLQPYQILNPQQRSQLYSHPLVSVALVERYHQYPKEVVRAIGEHQEYTDGSGYPRSLSGAAISPLGRIVALSQVAAAMFAAGRNAPEMRISVLLRMTTNLYDRRLATRLMTLLKPRQESMGQESARMQDPVKLMLEVDRLLVQLPQVLGDAASLDAARREERQLVLGHSERIRAGLARVGAASEQLAQLAGEALDDGVLDELSLLTNEAVWQLRTLARHAGRRLKAEPGKQRENALEDWLAAVDAAVATASAIA